MIKIKELVFEDGYVLGSDSYCRKYFFVAEDEDTSKAFKIKTFLSVLDAEDIRMLDAFSEVNIDNKWNNVLDTIPVEVSVENIKKMQTEVFENTLTFLFEKNVKMSDIKDSNLLKAFNWDEFDKSLSEDNKILNVIDFSHKDS